MESCILGHYRYPLKLLSQLFSDSGSTFADVFTVSANSSKVEVLLSSFSYSKSSSTSNWTRLAVIPFFVWVSSAASWQFRSSTYDPGSLAKPAPPYKTSTQRFQIMCGRGKEPRGERLTLIVRWYYFMGVITINDTLSARHYHNLILVGAVMLALVNSHFLHQKISESSGLRPHWQV